MSYPARVPSASIEFNKISPTPSAQAFSTQASASISVPSRPPCVVTSKPDSVRARRASTDKTKTCAPKRSAISAINSGRAIAEVLIEILSAPARSSRSTSCTLRIPPPTVSGIKTCSAVRRTTSKVVSLPTTLAEISRKVNSSAPSIPYTEAISTGSPASTRLVKLTPLTTRPSVTSRQGIIRTESVICQSTPTLVPK